MSPHKDVSPHKDAVTHALTTVSHEKGCVSLAQQRYRARYVTVQSLTGLASV